MDLIVRRYDESLEYVVSLPTEGDKPWPVLCFLHGVDEGAIKRDGKPHPICEALTLHGPLRSGCSRFATDYFIVVAPQLPKPPGVHEWGNKYAEVVKAIVKEVQEAYNGDPKRTSLTGFSLGGNGVFDIGLPQRTFWAALWPVEPTTTPSSEIDPNDNSYPPVWLSLSEPPRGRKEWPDKAKYDEVLGPLNGKFHCSERGQGHVPAARLAYQDNQIYEWLRTKYRP